MADSARTIMEALGLIHICCETIEECGGCEACPMGEDCFDYNSLLDSYENVSADKWEAFIGFASDVDDYIQELKMSDQDVYERELLNELDMKSKGERDERAIDW